MGREVACEAVVLWVCFPVNQQPIATCWIAGLRFISSAYRQQLLTKLQLLTCVLAGSEAI